MTKKKRRREIGRQPRREPKAQPARTFATRGRLVFAGLAVALAIMVIAARLGVYRSLRAGPGAFPPPLPVPRDTASTRGDFAGAEACAQCHVREYEAWAHSTHGRAGGLAGPSRVIAPFNGVPMRFKDAVVTPSMTRHGQYIFTVARRNWPAQRLRVAAVVGGAHLFGGGTQSFFTEFRDGTLRFLPFDFSRQEGVWFCNTNGRTNRGAIPVTPALALLECGDWPPQRILGSSARFPNCQQCHGSQIEVMFNASAKRYETRFTTLAINCESCHGPGRRHVELARSGKLHMTVDIGIAALDTLSKDQSVEVCFQCHAVKEQLQPGYLPGKPLQQYFALKFPTSRSTLYLPDGRTKAFAYQEGHLYSDCYRNGSMTCVSCHEPHSQRYRSVNGEPLAGRFHDGQCLGCHPSKAAAPQAHTRHAPESPGSRCVSCHMPYLQEAAVGHRIRYARSDHTIAIPRPGFDAHQGVENACQQCHRDRPAAALQALVEAWYGTLKPHPALVRGLVQADTVVDRRTAGELLLRARDRHPAAQYAALTNFLLRYLAPDLPALEPVIADQLKQLSKSDDLDVQALALMTLHFARGEDSEIRSFLVERLRALRGPHDRAIRDRWALGLYFEADRFSNANDFQTAISILRKAQAIDPEDPAALRNLGVTYARLGDLDTAVELLERAVALGPGQPRLLIDLAVALGARGDVERAIMTARQAIAIDPWEPIGYLTLGNARLRRGEVRDAAAAYEEAVARDPSLAAAHFQLAEAYGQLGRSESAAAALARGLEFDPRNVRARKALDVLRRGNRPAP